MSPERQEKSRESLAWKTLFTVSLINSAQAAFSVVGIPSFAESASLNSTQLTALLVALPVSAGASALSIGSLSDFFDRKRILQVGLAILGLSLCLHPLADSFVWLLALRICTGLATGMLMGLPSTLLSDRFRKERQQSLNSKTLCGYAIGQTIGIPMGIVLMEWTSFLVVCSIFGALALLCLAITNPLIQQSEPSRTFTDDFLSRYLHDARDTFRDRRFTLIASSSFLSFSALSMFYVTFALWLFDEAQLRPAEIAPMYLAGGILQVLVLTYVVNRLSKFPPLLTVIASLLLNTVLFATAYPAFQQVNYAAGLFALTLGAVSLRIPSLQFLLNNTGTPSLKGLRMSLNQTSSHLGKALGAFAAGGLYPVWEAHHITLSCGGITLFCTLLFLRSFMSDLNEEQNPNRAPRERVGKCAGQQQNSRKREALARTVLIEDV